ncbi:MAG: membrane dipeptidase [Alphaproteobacteria bacterium]|nr:membrane dipeptidase [Alphaproteobacteria bacterium]
MEHSFPERPRFEEWRRGGVDCVHITLAIWEDARDTLKVIGKWHRHFEAHGDLIALATSVDDVERIARSGRTAVVFGFQNTSPFEDDIDLVRTFHALGVRIVQLTYNIQNNVANGCWEDNDAGLSKVFGRNVVAEMNKLGMLIDLSHCNERTCFDTIEASSLPVAITHANPSEFVGMEIELKRRNKSTPLIKALAKHGGVIGLSMYPRLMRGGSDSSLKTFCDMLCWTVDLVGVDHGGFGTDLYTGWPEAEIVWWRAGRFARQSPLAISPKFAEWPRWFRSPSDFPKAVEGLAKRGFSRAELDKIIGGNWMRLFGQTWSPAP